MRNTPLQNSIVRAVHGVESVDAFAGVKVIDKVDAREEIANLNKFEHAVSGDGSIDVPCVVFDADDHRPAIKVVGGNQRSEEVGNRVVAGERFLSGFKAGLHTSLSLVVEPKLWRMLARAPRQTWGYAYKYHRRVRIHPSALGGFTLEGPYRRRSRVRAVLNRFFYWLGA